MWRDYDRKRRARIAAGRWQQKVDPSCVREHVARLRESGMTVKQIAAAAGVHKRTLYRLNRGDRSYLTGLTAEAILAVEPAGRDADNWVSIASAEGKVRSLVALGWSFTEQARRIGMVPQQVWDIASGRHRFISRANNDRVSALFEQLSGTPGPSRRAVLLAQRRGWKTPLAGEEFDDCSESSADFVDEVAVDMALAGHRVALTDAELIVVLQAGVARGEPLTRLAGRLGVNYWGARKMLGGEVTPRREKRARVEAELLRAPNRPDSNIAALLDVHHQTVTRARARLVASGALGAA